MGSTKKRSRTRIQVSWVSLLCLFLCWIGATMLSFYVGTLVGRRQQAAEIRARYRSSERGIPGDEMPEVSFPRELVEQEVGSPATGERLPGPLPTGEPNEGGSTPPRKGKVLQVASFQDASRADRMVRSLLKKGYRAFRGGCDGSDGVHGPFRVFVGPLRDLEQARLVKARLEREEGFRKILVRPCEKAARTF